MIDLPALLTKIDLYTIAERDGAQFKKSVNGYRSACPLHGGKNPTSFGVWQEQGVWHWRCWSDCGTGGTAIDYVKHKYGIHDFMDAVQKIAELANVDLADYGLTPQAAAAAAEHKRRTDVLDIAAQFAAAQLWQTQHALDYARSRGLSDEILRLAGWGYLDGSTALRDALLRAGADVDLAAQLGLLRFDGTDYTANAHGSTAAPHGWIVYPHRPYTNAKLKACPTCSRNTYHVNGLCLACGGVGEWGHLTGVDYLSGRAVETETPRENPKDKSRNLPGARKLYKAEVPQCREIVLCEGPADAESYRQLGQTAWALCGLGELPANERNELAQRAVYVALDGDAAGQKKVEALATAVGPLAVLLEPVEGAKDANDWLRAGATPDDLRDLLAHGKTWIEIVLARVEKSAPHQRAELTRQTAALLNALPDELAPAYKKQARRALGMTRSELETLLTGSQEIYLGLAAIRENQICWDGAPLCNFAAKITHELSLDDGMYLPTVRYTVTGKLNTGEPLPTVEVAAEDFSGLNWIARYWGARPIVYIAPGQAYKLTRAIQEISLPDIERDRVYTRTGWAMIDGEWSFLTTNGRITANGLDNETKVETPEHLKNYALPAPPNGRERDAAIKKSVAFLGLAPLRVSAPLWCSIFAAPLTEVIPLYAALWVYGSTQSGKSTIAHLALTHFGGNFVDGRQYHAPIDWISTRTHIEEAMFSAKDLPLIIDDYAPQMQSRQEAQGMAAKAQIVMRSMGNRSARGRSGKYQKQTLTPRGLVISTAELPLAGEGIVGRMLYVPVEKGDVIPLNGSTAMLDAAQADAQDGVYAAAMSAYIQWLAANWETASKKALAVKQEEYEYIKGKNLAVQPRLLDYYATLAAGAHVAFGAFVEMGAISANDALAHVQDIVSALESVIVGQAERISEQSPVRKLFEALNSMLAREKIYFAPRTRSYQYEPPKNAMLIGWMNPGDDVVYLDDDAILEVAREFWAAQGENYDVTTDSLKNQMRQMPDLLERDKDGNTEKSAYLAGKNRRALCVRRARVNALYGIDLANESDYFAGGD